MGVRRGVKVVGGMCVCRGSCLRRNDERGRRNDGSKGGNNGKRVGNDGCRGGWGVGLVKVAGDGVAL